MQSGADPDRLVLSEEEAEFSRFGEAIGASRRGIREELWRPLKARYSETTLVDLVAFAGIMVATNVFTDVVDTPLDDELREFVAKP